MKTIINYLKELRTKNVFNYYILVLLTLYAIWKIYKATLYQQFDILSKWGEIINFELGLIYQKFISLAFNLLAIPHTLFIEHAHYGDFPAIALPNNAGIFIAYHCLGVTAFYLYIGTLWFLPGKAIKKIYFSLLGAFVMFFINSFRLSAMVILRKHASEFLFELNHSLIFVLLIYITLFLMHFWYLISVKKQENLK